MPKPLRSIQYPAPSLRTCARPLLTPALPPVLQGALDGGLDIPHNEKRFVGYDADAKEFDAETMKKYIFGGHVAEYMEGMEEEEPEKFRDHFKNYLDNEVEADADEIEELYSKVRSRHGTSS